MRFIGREKEVKAINNLISKNIYQGCIVYGRRRLGKTMLLKHCLLNKGIPCIFFQCSLDSEESNTFELTKLIEKELNLDHLYFSRFIDAIKFVFEKSLNTKIYFTLDEYTYIEKVIPGFDSLLQKIIDEYMHKANISFFLCGSSISSMESILSKSNPLYQRFHLSILLQEMDYLDAAKFYPDFSNEDKVRLYAAFGGIPFYLAQINDSLSVKENIINLLSSSYASLSNDISINLKAEMSKINNANSIFSVISEQKAFHYSDILSKSHIASSASLNDILEKLMSMDLIEYVCPINDKNNKHKSGYIIKDSATRFYYRYIYNNRSAVAIMDNEEFYNEIINDDFESALVPKTFENIAKQYLIRRNQKGLNNPTLIDIGSYWYDDPITKTNGQFDVVGKSKTGYIFYEVKFTKKPINDAIIEEELSQVSKSSLKPIKCGFISRSGFDIKNITNIELIDLKDIYNI